MPPSPSVVIRIEGPHPTEVADAQDKIKRIFGVRASVSQVMHSKHRPGEYVAFVDIYPDSGVRVMRGG